MGAIGYQRSDDILTTDRPVEKLSEYVALMSELDRGEGGMRALLFRGQYVDQTLLPKCARAAKGREWTREQERYALRDFRRQATPMIQPDSRPESPVEWLALAQHHGMATRLLDWTDRPFVALWFALNWLGPYEDEQIEPIVWALAPAAGDIIQDTAAWKADPLAVRRTYVICPRHTAGRLRAQSGWFTLHHRHSDRHIAALETQGAYHRKLRRIRISPLGKSGQHLRRELYRCGITASVLFPDLGGISETINQHIELAG